MHTVCKLVALSAVFGLVLTSPAAKITDESFDDLAFDSWYDIANSVVEYVPDQARIVEAVAPLVPKIGFIPFLLSLIPKIVGLKVIIIKLAIKLIKLALKPIKLVLKLIKGLAPKAIFLAIGGIATFGFCKLTSLCGFAASPVVYDMPSGSVATPQLEDAQEFLVRALQQYAKQ